MIFPISFVYLGNRLHPHLLKDTSHDFHPLQHSASHAFPPRRSHLEWVEREKFVGDFAASTGLCTSKFLVWPCECCPWPAGCLCAASGTPLSWNLHFFSHFVRPSRTAELFLRSTMLQMKPQVAYFIKDINVDLHQIWVEGTRSISEIISQGLCI